MNYCIAVEFILAALLQRVISGGSTLYYYNRNTGKVEYNSGDNGGGNHSPPPLYIKRYFCFHCLISLHRGYGAPDKVIASQAPTWSYNGETYRCWATTNNCVHLSGEYGGYSYLPNCIALFLLSYF